MNCVYFYPKEYIEEADKRGLIDKDAVMKKGKQVMIPFCIILFVVLIAIIFVWNKVTDFKTAYLQSYLFLVVMNWFDGIMLDRVWVGHSKICRNQRILIHKTFERIAVRGKSPMGWFF